MSDEGNDGGDMNLRLSKCGDWLSAPALKLGDADRVARCTGVAGRDISTGGPKEPCDS